MSSTYEVSGEEALQKSYDITNKKIHVYPRANIVMMSDNFTNNTTTAAYTAGDVISSASSTGTGGYLEWSAIARANGATGKVVQAQVICSTVALTDAVSLLLFNAVPTGMLDDNVANTEPVVADLDTFIGRIDFPALASVPATAYSTAWVTEGSTLFTMPMYFTCATDADDLYGILIARGVLDSVATAAVWYVKLWVEQF